MDSSYTENRADCMLGKESGLCIPKFYYVMNCSINHTSTSLLQLEAVPRGLPLAAVTLCPFTTNAQHYWTQIVKHRKNSYWEFDGEVGRCQQRAGKQQLSFASYCTDRRRAATGWQKCMSLENIVWASAGDLLAGLVLLVHSVLVARKGSFLEQAEVAVVSLVKQKMSWHCLYRERVVTVGWLNAGVHSKAAVCCAPCVPARVSLSLHQVMQMVQACTLYMV